MSNYTMVKTINRGWLKRQVKAGKIEARCTMHLTDDYAFDNAYDFGKTGWMPARLREPRFEQITLQNGSVIDHCADDDRKTGCLNMDDCDFDGKSGSAYLDAEGIIHLRVHSNLHFELRCKV